MTPPPVHPRVTEVARILREAGSSGEVRVLPADVRTAAAAAAALEVPVGAIVNSLLFTAVGQPVLVLTSGAHRVDGGKVAALLGVPSLEKAAPEVVREVTGQPIGGVAPVGHPEPIGTLVDVELARHPRVWAAAGHPAAVFPTTYEELLALTAGTAAEVGDGPSTPATGTVDGSPTPDVAEAVGT
ncbi:YbaK/EbsC family protein [Blastococcus sp. TF02A-30]|uniref:YbaK/EbsC family protein n=1 Tax=Blastococcus sp. TF02A-30 TaxID=2250580 RepID=UPI000DE959BC|nr:YbaK/EbsC family protein [Blastococcus sp. TF02A-30]RBY85559.1 YbaK/EbsC family protein [Blastococcus sp. TF02A-30]